MYLVEKVGRCIVANAKRDPGGLKAGPVRELFAGVDEDNQANDVLVFR